MAHRPPVAKIIYFCESKHLWAEKEEEEYQDISKLPKCCYIFLPAEVYNQKQGGLFQQFNAPALLATEMCIRINGFFGSRSSYDEQGRLKGYSTWYRCLVKMLLPEKLSDGKDYKWYEMTFVSRWEALGQQRILCIDTPTDFPSKLSHSLNSTPPGVNNPFTMHIPLLEEIVRLKDESVWAIRNPIREVEKRRPTAGPNFEAMHEISRHSIHVSEVLAVNIQTFEKIQEQQQKIYAKLPVAPSLDAREQADEYLQFQIQMLKSLKERSISNQSRLASEITVAYNRIAQQDNRVMKSIGLLTMTFLPATFISAIFSTTFFEFGEDELHASKQIWLYWGITIGCTLLVVIAWRSLLDKKSSVIWRSLWTHVQALKWDQVKNRLVTEERRTEKNEEV